MLSRFKFTHTLGVKTKRHTYNSFNSHVKRVSGVLTRALSEFRPMTCGLSHKMGWDVPGEAFEGSWCLRFALRQPGSITNSSELFALSPVWLWEKPAAAIEEDEMC